MANKNLEINDIEFGIVLPRSDNKNHTLNTKKHQEVAKRLTDRFGGVTIYPRVVGGWKNDDGDYIFEENMIMTAMRNSESTRNFQEKVVEDEEWMDSLAREVGDALGQASIFESIDKKEVEFIQGDFSMNAPEKFLERKKNLNEVI